MQGIIPTTSLPGIQPKIALNDGILVLRGNLQRAEHGAFQQACADLCECELSKVTLNLTKCTYGTSSFIGDVVEAVTQMKSNGKDVNVLVSPELGRLLHMAHLYHLFSYKVVDPRLEVC